MSQNITRPFTLDYVKWNPWIETVEEIPDATPEQLAVLEKVAPRPTGRAYYAFLAHDPKPLEERTALMHNTMYSRDGLSRADREFAAAATSRENGCVHCASVHARLYGQLTKDNTLIQRLLDEGVQTPLEQHERVIVDFAIKLTRDPAGLTAADLKPLRDAGFDDLQIYDLSNVIGMFTWANQLFLSTGENEPVEA